jgi:cytidine deaminase
MSELSEYFAWLEPLIRAPSITEIEEQKAYVQRRCSEIEKKRSGFITELAKIASERRKKAKVDVTGYKVGSAALSKSGTIYPGKNIEYATLTPTVHGESSAITVAFNYDEDELCGDKDFLEAMAISHDIDTAPCGICRQIMVEAFSNPIIIVADPEGNVRGVTSLKILMFWSFSDYKT